MESARALDCRFALAAGTFAQADEVLLADGHVAGRVAGAGVVDKHFEVHLRFATQAFDIGKEVPLVGTDGTAECVVVVEGGCEAEGQDGREFEAVRDDPGVILGCLLVEAFGVGGLMLGDDHRQITGGKEERLITEESRNAG